MDRMKTFLSYALLIIGFYIFSIAMERGLINQMYYDISGDVNDSLVISDGSNTNLTVVVEESKTTRENGYLVLAVTNNSGHDIESCVAKIDLFSVSGNLIATEYQQLNNLKVNETRRIKVKFKAHDVGSYKITLQEKAPYKDPNIVNVFGWDINLGKILGIDLSKIADGVDGNSIKNAFISGWNFAIGFASTVPLWAYVIAGGIVLWHMPTGFLFGIFPF